MARWLVVVVVVLGGAFLLVQVSSGGGEDGAVQAEDGTGEAAARAAERPALKAARPASRPGGVDGPGSGAPSEPTEGSVVPGPGARGTEGARPAPRGAAGQDGAASSVAAVIHEAQALHQEGRRADALALLRQARGEVGSPRERARLGLELALKGGAPAERRKLLGEALAARQVVGGEYEQVGALLRELNADPAASLLPLLQTASYRVRPNDSLWKLCHRVLPEEHDVRLEVGLLRLVNRLASDGLQVGQTLVVPLASLRLIVDRDQRGLVAWLGQVPLAAYRVGLGKGGSTPSGEFVVQVKQENPAWTYQNETIPFGDPRNILGTRWLGFEDHPGVTGYGIHGTARPETIGRDESMGCVRMRNVEVEELFELVPRGTRVAIP